MFYYYGAKNQLAKYYPNPSYNFIIEPFAGSAAYSVYHLNKNENLNALIIEKDKRVYDTWKYLLACSATDIINYPTPEIGEQTTDFLIMTCSVSNATSKCKSMKFTPRIAKVFGIQQQRIVRLIHISNRIELVYGDYRDAKNIEATWFIDPPYQLDHKVTTKTVFPNGNGYSLSCNADKLDYNELSNFCQNRKGQCIVCEKNNANWLPFQQFNTNKNSLNKIYKELIWIK